MKIPFHLVRPTALLGAAVLLLSGPALRADDDNGTTTSRIKFSDPSKPGTLAASLPWADIEISGTDGNEIVVTSTIAQKGHQEERPDGLRRLDEEVSFELFEKNNTVSLRLSGENAWAAHGAEFKVQVPRNTALVLRTEAGGDLTVLNINGDVDISSANGPVTMHDLGGAVVVNTLNGEINASFKAMPAKALSLSSMNGEIFVKVPSDAKANLRMRSHNGAILTDFPEGALKARSENSARHASLSADSATLEAPEAPEAPETPEARAAADTAKRDAERAMRDAQKAARAAQKAMKENSFGDMAPFPPLPHIPIPAFGGKSIVGTLNGGGVDVQLATMNGTITLRQNK